MIKCEVEGASEALQSLVSEFAERTNELVIEFTQKISDKFREFNEKERDAGRSIDCVMLRPLATQLLHLLSMTVDDDYISQWIVDNLVIKAMDHKEFYRKTKEKHNG